MQYKVDRNMPIPTKRKYGDLYDTLESLQVGDSFEFESEARQNLYQRAVYRNIKVAIRKLDDNTCRVWRIS